MHKHKLKVIRTSGILWKGNFIEIEIFQCQEKGCEKYLILDNKTGKRIRLNGLLGKEID